MDSQNENKYQKIYGQIKFKMQNKNIPISKYLPTKNYTVTNFYEA